MGLMAQRITRLTTDQKIAGSNPAGIDLFHSFPFSNIKFPPPHVYLDGAWVVLNNTQEKQKQKKVLRPRVGSNHQPFG